uniref:Uncharacterized protein n=1 Tax=Aegilops tauschii subsp. strangulata TaxID=200361 RepID=A0A453LZ73_AEGTS
GGNGDMEKQGGDPPGGALPLKGPVTVLRASHGDKHNSDTCLEHDEINKAQEILFEEKRDPEDMDDQHLYEEQGQEIDDDLTETEVSDSLLCDGVINLVTTFFWIFALMNASHVFIFFLIEQPTSDRGGYVLRLIENNTPNSKNLCFLPTIV